MRLAAIAAASLAALGLAAHAGTRADLRQTAVVVLYSLPASAELKVDATTVARLGCEVLRAVRIRGHDGDITLAGQPDALVALSCPRSLIGQAGTSSATERAASPLDGLVQGGARLAVFEGHLEQAPRSSRANGGGRQYVVKVSTNNNVDPAARERDFAEIGAMVAGRPNRYSPEAVIRVDRALGTHRPDEVAILYYDSADAGERFRADNPDVLDRIGQFNRRHVHEFVYFAGEAAK